MQICIMSWKTFLELFKQDYSLFYFDGIDWRYKITGIKINLHLTDEIIGDRIVFFDKGGLYLNGGI